MPENTPCKQTLGGRISDISEDLHDELIGQIKTSYSALQVDEATYVVKERLQSVCVQTSHR
jgi:hypothetical protein